MLRGPRGEKRPADVISNAVRIMEVDTGEVAEDSPETATEYAPKGGLIGGSRRAEKLSKKRRTEIARKAARARWKKESVKKDA